MKQKKTEKILILQVETQQLDQFKEVTVGADRLYSIPSVTLQHQGTYQCEVYSGQLSLIRVYYYISGKISDFRRIFGNFTDQWESHCTRKKASSSHLKQQYFVPEKGLNTKLK